MNRVVRRASQFSASVHVPYFDSIKLCFIRGGQHANARTGRRRERGRQTDNSEVLGTYGGDAPNENGNLLLRVTENNKLAILNTFFFTHKNGASCTFQNGNHGEGQERLDYILIKQVDNRLVPYVNIRSPLLIIFISNSPHPKRVPKRAECNRSDSKEGRATAGF